MTVNWCGKFFVPGARQSAIRGAYLPLSMGVRCVCGEKRTVSEFLLESNVKLNVFYGGDLVGNLCSQVSFSHNRKCVMFRKVTKNAACFPLKASLTTSCADKSGLAPDI